MSFKSIFDKLQPKQDAVRWLAPLRRRARVKMNLKDVSLGRADSHSIFDKKPIIEPAISVKKPVSGPSLSNIQKIDPMVSKRSMGSEEIKLPPRSQWSDVKADMKPKKSILSLVFLILAGLIFSGSGLYLYAANKIDAKDNIVKECKSYLTEQRQKSIQTTNLSCDVNVAWYEWLFADTKAKTAFDSIKTSLTKQGNELKIEVDQIEDQIKSLKSALSQFNPDFETRLPATIKQPATTIEEKKSLLAGLKDLEKDFDSQIATQLKTLKNYIGLASGIDVTQEQTFVDSLAKKPKQDIYKVFPEFEISTSSIKQKLVANNTETWYAKQLDNPDLFTFKINTGDDVKLLLENASYPQTTLTQSVLEITGDKSADDKIRSIAEKRGYKQRPLAIENGLVQSGNEELQAVARDNFQLLVDAASEDGVRIGLVSGYRSPADQKNIFLTSLRQKSLSKSDKAFTNAEIAAGLADEVINSVLESVSIPGYSRHHTGYAVDITDLNSRKSFTQFAETEGYRWMSANNYFNAKRFGFLPSYPNGATNQGPEPEAWEYTFVGVEVLKK